MGDIKITTSWDQYKEVVPKVLPLVFFYGIVEILKAAAHLPESLVYHVLLFGSVIFIVYFVVTVFSKADNQIWKGATDMIDHTIDKTVQAKIYDGLQTYRFVDEFVEDEVDMLARARINDVAVRALVPTVYQNHHCREIKKMKGAANYLDAKSTLVVNAFKRDKSRVSCIQFVINKLPKGVTFEEAVNAYVYRLFHEVFGPTLRWACEEKIVYYKEILKRKDLSNGFREETRYRIKKNEEYILLLEELLGDSCLISKSAVAEQLDFNINDTCNTEQ